MTVHHKGSHPSDTTTYLFPPKQVAPFNSKKPFLNRTHAISTYLKPGNNRHANAIVRRKGKKGKKQEPEDGERTSN